MTTAAAIYARKSQEQGGDDEDKSVTLQVERAKAYAIAKGFTVNDAHVYVDDGISGADFVNRDGLTRLLAAVNQTPRSFDVLITRAINRMGREMIRLAGKLLDITEQGVRIFIYSDGSELKLDTPLDKMMVTFQSYAAEDYRANVRKDTREKLHKKASAGKAAGGPVFGYTNVRHGSGKEGYSIRVINEPEAIIIRRIFKLAAEGYGLLRINRTLEAEGINIPVTTIKGFLHRELYLGKMIYGRKRNVDGKKGDRMVKVAVPESEWIKLDQPDLIIVTPELWTAAHARMDRTRQTWTGYRKETGTLTGRPEAGLTSQHLLAGFLRCGVCQGSMFVAPRVGKGGNVTRYYLCTNRHKQGGKVCGNRYALPYDAITDGVLAHFDPARLERELLEHWFSIPAPEPVDQRATAQAALTTAEKEIANLVEAIAAGGDMPALVARLKASQRAKEDAQATLKVLDMWQDSNEPLTPEEIAEINASCEPLTFRSDPATGRQVLRKVLAQPITVSPVLDDSGKLTGWDYLGQANLAGSLVGQPSAGPLSGSLRAQVLGTAVINNPQLLWAVRG